MEEKRVEVEQKNKILIKKLEGDNEELKGNTTHLKSQDEKLQNLRHKVKIWETTKRKWTKTLLRHKKQQEASNNQVKALTKKGAGKCFNRFGIGKFEECVLKKSCSPC